MLPVRNVIRKRRRDAGTTNAYRKDVDHVRSLRIADRGADQLIHMARWNYVLAFPVSNLNSCVIWNSMVVI